MILRSNFFCRTYILVTILNNLLNLFVYFLPNLFFDPSPDIPNNALLNDVSVAPLSKSPLNGIYAYSDIFFLSELHPAMQLLKCEAIFLH